jgi:hypothetical protein
MASGKIPLFDGQNQGDAFVVQGYNRGAPGGSNYDMLATLQGKGGNAVSIASGGGVGSTSVTFVSSPVGLQPGSYIFFGGGGVSEVVKTTQDYVAGTNPVSLASAIQNASHTVGAWNMYSAFGPTTIGFLPDGIIPTTPSLWDPVSFKLFLQLAATQNAASYQTSALYAPGLDNGTSLDKQISNQDNLVIIANATYTSNQTSVDFTNINARGLNFYVKTGAQGIGAANIIATLQGKDPVSGTYYTLFTSAAFPANSFILHQMYPGLLAVANLIVNAVLPRTWRVALTATQWGTGGSTIGVSASLIV